MSISLEKVAEKYLVAKKLSAGTRKEYRSTVTKWLSWGQGVDVDRIERRHIRDFLVNRLEDCKVSFRVDGRWYLYYNGWTLNPTAKSSLKAEYAIGLAFAK
jgi:hypothetical protein